MIFVVWTIYLTLLIFTYLVIKGARINTMGICYGALIGLVFFLAIPMFFILIFGQLYDPDILIEAYLPYFHVKTTFNIFVGWIVVLVSAVYERYKYKARDSTISSKVSAYVYTKIMVVLYVFITFYFAYSTGAFEGLHWHDTQRNESSSFIIFKNFANCYRVVFFGAILYLIKNKKVSLMNGVLLSFLFSAFDVLISFNRITLVYLAFLLIILSGKRSLYLALSVVIFSPIILHISGVWTWFRGAASVGGINFQSFYNSWLEAQEAYVLASNSFVVRMNGIFESSNILVFHGLVERVGNEIPIFYGLTYIVRPLTTFIPSTVWENKPKVFGTYIGDMVNGYEGLALNSTLFGEAYANFYYAWPLILFLTLITLSNLYSYFSKFVSSSTVMSIFIGISIWRFDMNFTIAAIYSLTVVYILACFVNNKRFVFK